MKSSSHFTVFEYGHLVSEEGDARINNAVVLLDLPLYFQTSVIT